MKRIAFPTFMKRIVFPALAVVAVAIIVMRSHAVQTYGAKQSAMSIQEVHEKTDLKKLSVEEFELVSPSSSRKSQGIRIRTGRVILFRYRKRAGPRPTGLPNSSLSGRAARVHELRKASTSRLDAGVKLATMPRIAPTTVTRKPDRREEREGNR